MKKKIVNISQLSTFQRSYLSIWLITLVIYSVAVAVTDLTLSLIFYSFMINLLTLPFLWIKFKQEEMNKTVDDAVAHFKVMKNQVCIGEDSLPANKVKRVAIDVQDDLAYCSLPFNHLKPGVYPNFIFPAEQAQALKQHIEHHLPGVSFVE